MSQINTEINLLSNESFNLNNKLKTDKTEYNRLYRIVKYKLKCNMISNWTNPPSDNVGNVAYVIEHQKRRFFELRNLLDSNSSLRIIIAGNPSTGEHALGTQRAKNAWRSNLLGYNQMIANITELVNNLLSDTEYNGRVFLGAIGFNKNYLAGHGSRQYCNNNPANNPSSDLIHVWGANVGNYNKKNGESFGGSGQVESFYDVPNVNRVTQQDGIFGIITMPIDPQNVNLSISVSNYGR
jgi:hypothetical protein